MVLRWFTNLRFYQLIWLPVCLLVGGALAAVDAPRPLQQESPAAWADEFTSPEPRWEWEYRSGSGYRTFSSLPGVPNLLELGITTASRTTQYSDCSLHERSHDYLTGVLEMRLRLSDDNGLQAGGRGTRGWGFWDGRRDGGDAAWFWSASSESDPRLAGFRAQVVRDNAFLLNQPIEVDMRDWHIYRIEMRLTGTRFLVDGVEVAHTTGKPANPQRVEIWVDNLAVQISTSGYQVDYLEIPQDQKMYLDWVRYYPASGSSNLPTDAPGTPAPGTPAPVTPTSPPGQDAFWNALPVVVRP